jgi:hypothetical protein
MHRQPNSGSEGDEERSSDASRSEESGEGEGGAGWESDGSLPLSSGDDGEGAPAAHSGYRYAQQHHGQPSRRYGSAAPATAATGVTHGGISYDRAALPHKLPQRQGPWTRRAAFAVLLATLFVALLTALIALAQERTTPGYAAYTHLIEAAATQPAAFRAIAAPDQPLAGLAVAELAPLQSRAVKSLMGELQSAQVPTMAMTLAPAAGQVALVSPVVGSVLAGLLYTAAKWSHVLVGAFVGMAGLGMFLL